MCTSPSCSAFRVVDASACASERRAGRGAQRKGGRHASREAHPLDSLRRAEERARAAHGHLSPTVPVRRPPRLGRFIAAARGSACRSGSAERTVRPVRADGSARARCMGGRCAGRARGLCGCGLRWSRAACAAAGCGGRVRLVRLRVAVVACGAAHRLRRGRRGRPLPAQPPRRTPCRELGSPASSCEREARARVSGRGAGTQLGSPASSCEREGL
jgi:hypothetical protein